MDIYMTEQIRKLNEEENHNDDNDETEYCRLDQAKDILNKTVIMYENKIKVLEDLVEQLQKKIKE